MSGPVEPTDAPPLAAVDGPAPPGLEVFDGREAQVGAFTVRRVLPRRTRRSVGPWCFADVMGPGEVTAEHGLDIGPHPHIGLQTVTWLVRGEVLHRDSLGSEQVIRPGQLNLMTAGHGVSHSEETAGQRAGTLHGIQLWVAQPDATRDGPPAFEHHAELPQVELAGARGARAAAGGAVATVLVGEFAGGRSNARRDTAHVGVELALRPGRTVVPLVAGFEHGLVVVDGAVALASGERLEPGRLGVVGLGRDELVLDAPADPAGTAVPTRMVLLGGEPLPEPLVMWWNYVGRSREEIIAAHRDWSAGHERFGRVASPLARIEVPGPPWAAPAGG